MIRPLSDTAPDVQDIQLEAYRRMSPPEKLARMAELCRTAYLLALAGLRQRHPAASEQELLLHLAVRRLGADTVARVYGWREA